jgi:hypothetical protein
VDHAPAQLGHDALTAIDPLRRTPQATTMKLGLCPNVILPEIRTIG